MKLIDSNIVIYDSKPGGDFLHSLLGGPDVAVSVLMPHFGPIKRRELIACLRQRREQKHRGPPLKPRGYLRGLTA